MAGEKTPETPDPIEIVEFISELSTPALILAIGLGVALGALGYWLMTHVTVEDERRA